MFLTFLMIFSKQIKLNKYIQAIQKKTYFPKYSSLVFVLLFITICVIYNYHKILFKPPQSIHLWRQSDCLSITLNYYQDNCPFFEPAIHNLGRNGTGKTVSDFPLIYYLVAKLWQVFGHFEFIYRLIVLLFFFSGLFALFKIFENILRDSILALTTPLLLFTSPTLVYFANNFLMDIPAFSMSIVGIYFFLRFCQTQTNRHLFLFAFFCALAGLLKISSLLGFFAFLVLFIFELLNVKLRPVSKVFQQPSKQILLLISVLIIQAIWYTYAIHYNAKNNSGIFLTGILPIWNLNLSEIKMTLDAINEHLKWDYFRKETFLVLVLMFVSILVFNKRVNKIILLLTIFTATGFMIFLLLFFQAFKDHDYYTINLFIVMPFTILSFLLLLKEKFPSIYTSLFLKIIMLAFLIHNIDFARRRIDARYNPQGWQNRDYTEYIKPFGEIAQYLQSIGINKNDKVISLSDNSINISLYLMNLKGWTNFDISGDSIKIKDKINLGAKYLFIYKRETYNEQGIQQFLNNKIGSFKNVDIYRL